MSKKREYKGIILYSDGAILEGHFANGVLQGTGRKIYSDSSYIEGTFVDGTLHGPGKYISADGNYYEGNYSNGVEEGKGKGKSGCEEYEGGYAQKKYQGQGLLRIDNDIEYEGTFAEGVIVQGECRVKSKQKSYKGPFKGGREHGYGELVSKQGFYRGYYENGEKNGEGFFRQYGI